MFCSTAGCILCCGRSSAPRYMDRVHDNVSALECKFWRTLCRLLPVLSVAMAELATSCGDLPLFIVLVGHKV